MATDDSSAKQSSKFDRRKVLKVGALGGVAGALTLAGMGNISGSSSSLRSTALSAGKNLDELLTALVHEKIVEPFSAITFFHVPANSTVKINQRVQQGYSALIREDRITVGQDHTLQMSVSIDGREVLFDPDVVQSRYNSPLNFLSSSSFYPVKQSFATTLTNLTSRAKYFSSMQSGGKIPTSQWDSIIRSHFAGILGR